MTAVTPSLTRNFSWTLAGNLVYAACLWGMLTIVTNLGSEEVVGRFSLASIIATPIIMLGNLQLRSVLATDAGNKYSLQDYLGVRLLALPLALLGVLVVAGLGYSREQAVVIGLFACARCVEAVSDLIYGYAQKHERLDLVARSLLIKGPASLLGFGAAFWVTRRLEWALVAMSVAWLIPLLTFDLRHCRRLAAGHAQDSLRPRWHWRTMGSLVWLALPLGLVMLLIQLRNTIPRTILEREWGEGELGVFAALAYFVIAGTTVVQALSQATLSRLAVSYQAGDRRVFRRTLGRLLLVGGGIGVIGVLGARLLGRPVLSAVYGAPYGARNDLLVLIMFAGGLSYVATVLGGPATAVRTFRSQLVVHLVNVALLLGLSLRLIPAHGAVGAAWVMLGGAAWTAVGYGFIVWHKYRALPAAAAPTGEQP